MSNSRLINDDCLKAMDALIAEGVVVDAIITDPPYGRTHCRWDSIIDLESMWSRLSALIKEGGAIVIFGSEPFSSCLRVSNIKNFKYDWVWNKRVGANFLQYKFYPSKVHEIVSVFGYGKTIYQPQMEAGTPYKGTRSDKVRVSRSVFRTNLDGNTKDNEGTRYPKSIIHFDKDKNKVHPTQKPVALLEYLVRTYTQEEETVLDFTMGSGTTGIACKKLNRQFIGIELEKKYFNIAKERIANEHDTLFSM